ncbi:MAG: hypothetical protein C0501_19970 [Isosphaera sp.]|nr:hypothetical protein [Isosphaera sp.]
MSSKWCCWAGLGLYAGLSVADWALTFALLKTNPLAFESNPLAAACLEEHGWGGLAVFKAAGVAVFAGAVVLLARRRPPVAAGVVAVGCAVLLAVTGYSHRLLAQSDPEPRCPVVECQAAPEVLDGIDAGRGVVAAFESSECRVE